MTRSGVAGALAAFAAASAFAQEGVQCPESAPQGVECRAGIDAHGAPYLLATPRGWNGVLVVHARDGPDLKPPVAERVADDFGRWTAFLKAGYAWAGTGYRHGGYDIPGAVEDLESVRALFAARFGMPRRTLLHGQGWGGNVAARAIEIHPHAYDGALLTSGELAGGSRGEDFRMDLRVVYQHYCRNHPRPGEPAYPLWMGLPPGESMSAAQVRVRFDECTGSNLPADARSAAQRGALASILGATRIPERTLAAHLAWGTLVFADLVKRLGGRNPFSTEGVRYSGTQDDAALNAGVPRYRPDAAALAQLSAESDPTGRIEVPVLTLHGIGDPTAFVEHESAYREAVDRAGNAGRLAQVFTTQAEHRSLGSAEYSAALAALAAWVDGGNRPTPAGVAARCRDFLARFEGESCRIEPGYRPPAWESRVYPRAR
jgi:hypothetical protein